MTDFSFLSVLAESEFDGWQSLYETPAVDLASFEADLEFSGWTPEDFALSAAEELLRS